MNREDILETENITLKRALATLRQSFIKAEPMIMYDGRFEQMMIAPINVIYVARELIEEMKVVEK